uniref:Integrase catalytic domain-containing protein n=1 Tax=Strongyloides papillosus TaxID=174720 RepID=A0A0N5BZE3_STREA
MFDSFASFDECISNDTTFVRLMTKLSPFQIKWEVKKKNSNSISDVPHFLIASKDAECETILEPKLIIDEYKNDYMYEVLKNQDRKKWPICLRKFKTVHEDQGLLFLDQRLFIPSTLHSELLSKLHGPHRSLLHMRRTIAMKFIVEGYTRKTAKFLINCKECQTAQKNLNKLISSLPKATFSSERIHIDNMVYGKSKICVMYDSFSRLTKAFFIKSYALKEMIKCVEKWIEEVGTISILVNDNHRPLISSEFDDWLKDHNIYHMRSIPYRSISNGSVERGIQSVRHGLNQHLSLAQT